MIDKMVGKTEVALYGLAYSIGMLVQLFISGMNSALTPWNVQQDQKGRHPLDAEGAAAS